MRIRMKFKFLIFLSSSCGLFQVFFSSSLLRNVAIHFSFHMQKGTQLSGRRTRRRLEWRGKNLSFFFVVCCVRTVCALGTCFSIFFPTRVRLSQKKNIRDIIEILSFYKLLMNEWNEKKIVFKHQSEAARNFQLFLPLSAHFRREEMFSPRFRAATSSQLACCSSSSEKNWFQWDLASLSASLAGKASKKKKTFVRHRNRSNWIGQQQRESGELSCFQRVKVVSTLKLQSQNQCSAKATNWRLFNALSLLSDIFSR